MSHNQRVYKSVAIFSSAALTLTACGGTDGDTESGTEGDTESGTNLQYAFFAPATSFPGVQMEEWSDRLAERTDGEVSVETFPGATLLDSGDIYPGVSSGIVDVGLDAPSYDPSQFPVSSAAALPLGFDDAEHASAAYLEFLLEEDPEELDGYHIVTAFTAEPAYIQTTEPVETLDDLSGMTLRSPGGAHNSTAEALGATPVGMPPPEIAENLGTGVLDGILGSREQLMDFEFAEFLPYLTEIPLGPSAAFVAVMDEGEFNSLPENVQDEIVGLREEMSAFAAEYMDSHAAESLEWAQENHDLEIVELDETEAAEWETILEGIVEDWVDANQDGSFDAQQVIDRLMELHDEHSQ